MTLSVTSLRFRLSPVCRISVSALSVVGSSLVIGSPPEASVPNTKYLPARYSIHSGASKKR